MIFDLYLISAFIFQMVSVLLRFGMLNRHYWHGQMSSIIAGQESRSSSLLYCTTVTHFPLETFRLWPTSLVMTILCPHSEVPWYNVSIAVCRDFCFSFYGIYGQNIRIFRLSSCRAEQMSGIFILQSQTSSSRDYACVESKSKGTTIRNLKIAFYKACCEEDLQSSSCGLYWLGLGSIPDVDDVSIRHEANEDEGVICLSVDLTSIATAASTATCEIKIADLLTDTFKPHGHSAPIDGSLDFSEVINLGAWLDSAMVRVSWTLPTGCEWKESSLPWVDAPWWDYEKADEIHIYTDGSAYKGSSSCAAVIWICDAETWYFGGYVRHLLPGRPCPHRAELHGLLLGCHWLNHALQALHVLYGTLPSVKFHFDATSAGYKAFGQWGGNSFGDLVGNIRSVCYYLESRYKVTLRYEHVKGHSNDPGNEAADTIAKLNEYDPTLQSPWLEYFDRGDSFELHWSMGAMEIRVATFLEWIVLVSTTEIH